MSTLVIALGNPLRSDDGAGAAVAEGLSALGLPGVSVRAVHQLTPELTEELEGISRVILVDAARDGDPVSLGPLPPSTTSPFTHELSPSAFAALAARLAGGERTYHLCRLRGENFEVGDRLSPRVRARVEEAVRRLAAFAGGRP